MLLMVFFFFGFDLFFKRGLPAAEKLGDQREEEVTRLQQRHGEGGREAA